MEKILIIGATSGIGERLSEELSKRKHEVYGIGRKEQVLQSMQEKGYIRDFLVADLATEEGIKKTAEYCGRKGVSCLLYAQGMLDAERLEDSKPGHVKSVIDVNLTSTMLTDQELLKQNKNPHRIIYLASISSLYAWDGGAAYQASKAGLLAYIQAMKQQDKGTGRTTDRIGLYPDTIATEKGMAAEQLSGYNKIPLDVFIKEVANITERKYDGNDFVFTIREQDGAVTLEELLMNAETLRPTFFKSKEIKQLGRASS
jgi:short-subunit dehydrogenase